MNPDFAKALVAIASELKNPAFDSTNPHYRNKYASLAGARNTITPVAAKHGVSVLQELTSDESGVSCETVLVHLSGEERKCGRLHLPAAKHDPQGFGSAATYARRYSLLAAFNIVGDDDDDAEAATKTANDPPPQKTRKASEKQIAMIRFKLDQAGYPEKEFLTKARLTTLEEITADRVDGALKFISEYVDERGVP